MKTVVGLTGGIGSGKSTVSKIFSVLGIPVYYADEAGKELLDKDPVVKQQVMDVLGPGILNASGKPDRKKIAKHVFNNKETLQKLNEIIHPAVRSDFQKWLLMQESAIVIKEAAILFESGAYRETDKIITVLAPDGLKIKRVMKRDGVTREEVQARIRNQWPDEEKVKRAHFIIVNDEQHALIPQVIEIYQKLLSGGK